MESSSSSAHGFAGGWPADDLGIILFRCADRFCRIRYGESTIEQSRERSNCFDFSNAERPSFRYEVLGGQRVSDFVLVGLSHYNEVDFVVKGRRCDSCCRAVLKS
jgi:hypothetical protein